jgi:DUF3068 family protein
MNLRRRRLLALAGVVSIAAAATWRLATTPRLIQRLPAGWHAGSRYSGTVRYADPGAGRIPEGDQVVDYDREQRLVDEGSRPAWVVFEERQIVRELATGAVVFEYATRDTVDPRTGAHLASRYRGDVAVFPREVQQTTYRLRSNYLKGIPVTFEREEMIGGLPTYAFSYHGPLESTESYAGTRPFPGIRPPVGQVIRCGDDRFYYRVWVEPHTGEQVKLEEGCPAGDYLVDVASGRPVAPVARWTGVTAGDALVARLGAVRDLRARYLWGRRYAPATLFGAGILLLVLAMRGRPVAEAA